MEHLWARFHLLIWGKPIVLSVAVILCLRVASRQEPPVMAAWPNGKALDYESRDCRFDPCRGHSERSLFCFGVRGQICL
jgi:hypothetical protein